MSTAHLLKSMLSNIFSSNKLDFEREQAAPFAIRCSFLRERSMIMKRNWFSRIWYRINSKHKDMLRSGKTASEIVDFCGYPYDKVKEIEESLIATAAK